MKHRMDRGAGMGSPDSGTVTWVFVLLGLIGMCVFFAIPTKCTGTISSTYWKRTVIIEDLMPVEGAGWTIPQGASVYNQYEKRDGNDNYGNPVYRTWYEYTTTEYQVADTVVSEGSDKDPYWAVEKVDGKQRITNRHADYYVYIASPYGGVDEFKTSKINWNKAEPGAYVTYYKSRFSNDIFGIKVGA